MRSLLLVLAAALLGLWSVPSLAQTRVDGSVYGLVYALQNQNTRHWDTYEGLRFEVRPGAVRNLSFKTNLRLARRGDPAEWDERVFNAYLDWRSKSRDVRVRLGRQFLYRGVINGSIDGLSLRAHPTSRLDVQVVGGVGVPFDRPLDVQPWDDGGVVGGYASYRFGPEARLDVSYVNRSRNSSVVWHQVGTALTGAWHKQLFYQAELDYNLESKDYQGMRYRLTYRPGRWSVMGEFNSQRPRVYEDSFFNVFQLVTFEQFRGGVTYQVGRYEVGTQYIRTLYDQNDASDLVLVTLGSRWGTIGVTYQSGFGGDRAGLYGSLKYDLRPGLTFRLFSSYYNYERRSIAVEEDATSFSGGLLYRPVKAVLLQAEVQQSVNNLFDNDVRGLFRVNYFFSRK